MEDTKELISDLTDRQKKTKAMFGTPFEDGLVQRALLHNQEVMMRALLSLMEGQAEQATYFARESVYKQQLEEMRAKYEPENKE